MGGTETDGLKVNDARFRYALTCSAELPESEPGSGLYFGFLPSPPYSRSAAAPACFNVLNLDVLIRRDLIYIV